MNLNKVTQEVKVKDAELDRKSQSLTADSQKAQQEKEAQRKELASSQDSLGQADKALKVSQLDTERKNHKSAKHEKEKSNVKARKELLKNNKAITQGNKRI